MKTMIASQQHALRRGIPMLFMIVLLSFSVRAQVKMGDNLKTLTPQALLELESKDKGFLMPRLNTAQMQSISNFGATATSRRSIYGLMVYNLDSACIAQYVDTNFTDTRGWRYLCGNNNKIIVRGAGNGLQMDVTNVVLGGSLDRKTIDTLNDFNMEWETNGNGNFMVRKRTTNKGDTTLFISNNGNAGIGVGSPAQRLDVGGNIQFSQALMPAGNAGKSGQVLISRGAGIAPVWKDSIQFLAEAINKRPALDSLAQTLGQSPLKDSLSSMLNQGDGFYFTANGLAQDLTSNFSSNRSFTDVFNNACQWGNSPNIVINTLSATLSNSDGTITIGNAGLYELYALINLKITFSANTGATETGGLGVNTVVIKCPSGSDATVASNWSVIAGNRQPYALSNTVSSSMFCTSLAQLNSGDKLRVLSYRGTTSATFNSVSSASLADPGDIPMSFLFKVTKVVGIR